MLTTVETIRYHVYMIHEMTSRGENFYTGYTNDPFRRWNEHLKKRYTKKCHACKGTGKYNVIDAMTEERQVITCPACAGSLRVPGNRRNLGTLMIVPHAQFSRDGLSGPKDTPNEAFYFTTQKEAMRFEKEVKKWRFIRKENVYRNSTKSIKECLEMN